jgi:aldehyde:ferredoxin oxidoreductase
MMECWELGILDKERTDGIDLSWGNWKGAIQVLHDLAEGKRFGVLAGKGVKFLSKYFSEEYGGKESLAQQGGYYLTNKGPSTTRPGSFSWTW